MLLSLVRSKGTPYGGRGALRKNSQTPASRTAPPRVKPIAVPLHDAIPSPPLIDTSPIVSPPLCMSYVDVVKNATPPASPPATENGGVTPTPDAVPAPEVLPQFEVKGPAPSPAAAAAAGSEDTVSRDYPAEPSMREDMLENVRAILESLSFEDRCMVAGVKPAEATYAVETVAGRGQIVTLDAPATKMVPPGVTRGSRLSLTRSRTSRSLPQSSEAEDERLARRLQAEENAEVERLPPPLQKMKN